jgi:hypothetical protein
MGYVLELRADSRIIPDWAWKSGRHPKKLAHILYFIFNFLTLGFLIFISTFHIFTFFLFRLIVFAYWIPLDVEGLLGSKFFGRGGGGLGSLGCAAEEAGIGFRVGVTFEEIGGKEGVMINHSEISMYALFSFKQSRNL